jgi:acid phosphatase
MSKYCLMILCVFLEIGYMHASDRPKSMLNIKVSESISHSPEMLADEGAGRKTPKGAEQIFFDTIHQNYYPLPNPKKGILDGNRKAPEHVSFSGELLSDLKKIKHVIVIFQENWSFDGLYGNFPGANGLSNAKLENFKQVDLIGQPYSSLLVCIDTRNGYPYPQIPVDLPNAPFNLNAYLPMDTITGDAIHHFYHEQYQISGGMMNRFAAYSNAGGFAVSYYDISETSMGLLAKEYVLCDNWFHSCYGGSMCGALWLFTAQMPLWPNPPTDVIARLLPSGILIKDGLASADGYAINDAEPFYPPYKKGTPEKMRVPPQQYMTIGDLLTKKGVSWKWYAEGWNDALAGNADPTFAFHHQAPVYFTQFAPGTKMRQEHLVDLEQFHTDLEQNQVPSVSIIRSLDKFSQHPSDGSLIEGLDWCANFIKRIQASTIWEECVIIVAYDENGGRWDHVSPPVVDRFGPGTRVPALIISPFAKKGYVDHTSYETVSILKFIEECWDLPHLSTRDAEANNIMNAFDFSLSADK